MENNNKKELVEIPGIDSRYNRHFKIPVIYHDNNFIIVNKPYDLRVDGDTKESETEESLILKRFPEYKGKLKLVHQLDHATSGIHCWGLNKYAARKSTKSFQQHIVRKTYLAVVRGYIEEDKFVIEKPIAKDPNHERRMMIGTSENPGKEAKTIVEVVKRGIFHPILCESPSNNSNEKENENENENENEKEKEKENPKDLAMEATLVKLYPHTGRTHQLRVHMKSIGHPIIGDYNYEEPFTDHERMMLHAWKINLPLKSANNNQSQKNKEFLQKRMNNKKIKIENNGELEDIILETENPFENLLTDK